MVCRRVITEMHESVISVGNGCVHTVESAGGEARARMRRESSAEKSDGSDDARAIGWMWILWVACGSPPSAANVVWPHVRRSARAPDSAIRGCAEGCACFLRSCDGER